MASLGSDMQATSNELVSVIEEMKEQRAEIDESIRREEEERNRLLTEINALQGRLTTIEDSLKRKFSARADLDKVINHTSEVFGGILEASKELLCNVRGESASLPRGNTR
ncbi:sporangia induced deflagellation-inducible protein [Trypanosoma grayi]|uniref:sporangia induced deflagellation-inducible protein n=1 Tax=Trypanosoma grayi TaxID=71804 RepID=UPI0004F4BBA2|nr:sporangia induced deflagellation-inducible protein [Trypanosoma grayi]KEG11770.1 sporangia induced deflagellation-inducible protein [Trypanosoma grayi]